MSLFLLNLCGESIKVLKKTPFVHKTNMDKSIVESGQILFNSPVIPWSSELKNHSTINCYFPIFISSAPGPQPDPNGPERPIRPLRQDEADSGFRQCQEKN